MPRWGYFYGEIEADAALRRYGSCLAVAHLAGLANWVITQPLTQMLSATSAAICWPFFPDCYRARVFGPAQISAVLAAYGLVALVALFAFFRRRTVALGWGALLAASALELGIVAQDYRLRLNQHYMTSWIALVFLFAPAKRRLLPYSLAAFYVAAAGLKLDAEWLSGAALQGRRPLFVPEAWIPAACAYVIVLELGAAFGLFAKDRRVFAATLAQLVVFHIVSWPVVHFYYPVLMLALLAIVPLARWLPAPTDAPAPGIAALFTGKERPATYAFLAIFTGLQLLPLAYPGDTAVTGQGRIFALHMFDSDVQCEPRATIHDQDGAERTVALVAPHTPARVHCDPIVAWGAARALCRRLPSREAFDDLDLTLRSKRGRAAEMTTVVAIPRFCHSDPRYSMLRSNAWIHSP